MLPNYFMVEKYSCIRMINIFKQKNHCKCDSISVANLNGNNNSNINRTHSHAHSYINVYFRDRDAFFTMLQTFTFVAM